MLKLPRINDVDGNSAPNLGNYYDQGEVAQLELPKGRGQISRPLKTPNLSLGKQTGIGATIKAILRGNSRIERVAPVMRQYPTNAPQANHPQKV